MPLLPGGDSDLQRAIFEALQAGKLRLVGADGLDRVVTRPGEIGVGQSSLRLAKPQTGESPAGGTTGDSGQMLACSAAQAAQVERARTVPEAVTGRRRAHRAAE